MRDRLPAVVAFLTDLERLKLVSRKAYVSDLSRRENSAEHSWHLAPGLLTLAQVLKVNKPVQDHAPELFAWMENRIEECVSAGWLIDA